MQGIIPFAAVICCGIIRNLKIKPVIKKIPICLFQGEKDPIVSVLVTRKKVKEIGNKLDIRLNRYPNLGHENVIENENGLFEN